MGCYHISSVTVQAGAELRRKVGFQAFLWVEVFEVWLQAVQNELQIRRNDPLQEDQTSTR